MARKASRRFGLGKLVGSGRFYGSHAANSV